MGLERGDSIAAGTDLVDDRACKGIGKDVPQPAPDDRMIVNEHDAECCGAPWRICFVAGRIVADGCGHASFAPTRFGSRIPSDFLRDPPDSGSRTSGSVNSTRVPWPARLVMRSVPPAFLARSLIPSRPSDRTFSRFCGLPTPLSVQ